jgi:hypothetical protein
MDPGTGRGAVSWPGVIPGPRERVGTQSLGSLDSHDDARKQTECPLVSQTPTGFRSRDFLIPTGYMMSLTLISASTILMLLSASPTDMLLL